MGLQACQIIDAGNGFLSHHQHAGFVSTWAGHLLTTITHIPWRCGQWAAKTHAICPNHLVLKVARQVQGAKSWLELVAVLKVKTMSFLVVCKMERHLQVKGAGRKGFRLDLGGRASLHG